MAKLGYTFYPKDWSSDDLVFELTLCQRAVYRETIDLAMNSDNKAVFKPSTWARKLNTTLEEINDIIKALVSVELIALNNENQLFIPSCEKRLTKVRSGKKGGQVKHNAKQTVKQTIKQSVNQEEGEEEREEEGEREKRFVPPKQIELLNFVQQYIEKKKTTVNAKLVAGKFWNHYEANGWKVGKNKMKDWKAAARNWVLRDMPEPIEKF